MNELYHLYLVVEVLLFDIRQVVLLDNLDRHFLIKVPRGDLREPWFKLLGEIVTEGNQKEIPKNSKEYQKYQNSKN